MCLCGIFCPFNDYFCISLPTFLDLQQELLEFELSDEEAESGEAPSTSTWSHRSAHFAEQWRERRPLHVEYALAGEQVGSHPCAHCSNLAVVRCRDCLPCQFLCEVCDTRTHHTAVLHNREATSSGFFQAIPPTKIVMGNTLISCGKRRAMSMCVCALFYDFVRNRFKSFLWIFDGGPMVPLKCIANWPLGAEIQSLWRSLSLVSCKYKKKLWSIIYFIYKYTKTHIYIVRHNISAVDMGMAILGCFEE